MASESNSGSTLIYPEPLSKKSDMRINRNKTYYNDEKNYQCIFQK